MAKSSHIHVNFSDIDANKLRSVEGKPPILETSGVAYITGALFFGAVDEFNHRMAEMPQYDHIILSMRGMPWTFRARRRCLSCASRSKVRARRLPAAA